MKKICLAILCAAACLSASAQSTESPYFGLRLSADVVCPGDMKAQNVGVSVYDIGSGVEIGGIYNMPIASHFYFEPGLKFYYDSYPMKSEFAHEFGDYNTDISIRKFGMRVPLSFGYRFNVSPNASISIFTGPELELGLSAKEHISEGNYSESGSLYGEDGGMRRFDALWTIGAGASFGHFWVGLSGSIGMLNLVDVGDGTSFRENRVSITLGYNF